MDEENLVRYVFTLELAGAGTTAEEAWLDALEALSLDPGAPPENFELDICPDPNDMSGRAD